MNEKVILFDDKYINQLIDLRCKEQLEYNHEEETNNLYNETMEYYKEHYKKDLFSFGIVIKNKIVATSSLLYIEYPPSLDEYSKIGYIFNVYTDIEYRNKGFQKKIIEKTINFCKEDGIVRIKLSTDNENARNLYESFGFKKSNTAMSLVIEDEDLS